MYQTAPSDTLRGAMPIPPFGMGAVVELPTDQVDPQPGQELQSTGTGGSLADQWAAYERAWQVTPSGVPGINFLGAPDYGPSFADQVLAASPGGPTFTCPAGTNPGYCHTFSTQPRGPERVTPGGSGGRRDYGLVNSGSGTVDLSQFGIAGASSAPVPLGLLVAAALFLAAVVL